MHSPPPGAISHSWHHAAGTLKLIGRAWRGYECYDWRSPGGNWVLIGGNEGACRRAWLRQYKHKNWGGHTHTHTRPIYLIYHNTHNLLHWSQRPQRHYTFSNVENNKEEPDCRILSGPGGESRRDRRNSQTIKLWGKGSSVSLENVRKVQLEQLREKCEGEHVATNDIELTDQSEHVLD